MTQRIKEYIDKKYTKAEISRIFDLPYNTIHNIVRRNKWHYSAKDAQDSAYNRKVRYRRSKAELELAKEKNKEAQEKRREAIEKMNEREQHRAPREMLAKRGKKEVATVAEKINVESMINEIKGIQLTEEDKDFVIKKALGRVYDH